MGWLRSASARRKRHAAPEIIWSSAAICDILWPMPNKPINLLFVGLMVSLLGGTFLYLGVESLRRGPEKTEWQATGVSAEATVVDRECNCPQGLAGQRTPCRCTGRIEFSLQNGKSVQVSGRLGQEQTPHSKFAIYYDAQDPERWASAAWVHLSPSGDFVFLAGGIAALVIGIGLILFQLRRRGRG
jgi:hypothetical protein